MIRSASDYQFVDASGLNVNGRIIPQLDVEGETPYVLRAEDMAFLAEMACERGVGMGPFKAEGFGRPVSLHGRFGSAPYAWLRNEPVFDTIAYHLNREYDFNAHVGRDPYCRGFLMRGPYADSIFGTSVPSIIGHYVNPSWTPAAKYLSASGTMTLADFLVSYRGARLPSFSVERGGPVLSPADMRKAIFGLEGLKCALVDVNSSNNRRVYTAIKMSGSYLYSYSDYIDSSRSYAYTANWTNAWHDTAVDNGRGGTFSGGPFATFSASRSRVGYTTEMVDITSLAVYTKETRLKSLKLGIWLISSGSISVRPKRYVTLFLDCTESVNDESAWTQKWDVDFSPITATGLQGLLNECGFTIPSSDQGSSGMGWCSVSLQFMGVPDLLYIEPEFRAEVGTLGWDWQPDDGN